MPGTGYTGYEEYSEVLSVASVLHRSKMTSSCSIEANGFRQPERIRLIRMILAAAVRAIAMVEGLNKVAKSDQHAR